jgi:hypothetical protein
MFVPKCLFSKLTKYKPGSTGGKETILPLASKDFTLVPCKEISVISYRPKSGKLVSK